MTVKKTQEEVAAIGQEKVEIMARIINRLHSSHGVESEVSKRATFLLANTCDTLTLEMLLALILTSRNLDISVGDLDTLEVDTFRKFLNW